VFVIIVLAMVAAVFIGVAWLRKRSSETNIDPDDRFPGSDKSDRS
jgi:hypothetical protein